MPAEIGDQVGAGSDVAADGHLGHAEQRGRVLQVAAHALGRRRACSYVACRGIASAGFNAVPGAGTDTGTLSRT